MSKKQRIKNGVLVACTIGVSLTIQEHVLAVTVKEVVKMYSAVYWTVGPVSFRYRVGLRFWYLLLLCVYFLRNRATEKAARDLTVVLGRRKE